MKNTADLRTLNVNAADAGRLQVIDDTVTPPRWKDVATCADTPNAINAAKSELERKGTDTANLWIKTAAGRRPIF